MEEIPLEPYRSTIVSRVAPAIRPAWGKLGKWGYAKIHSPHDLLNVLGGDPGPT